MAQSVGGDGNRPEKTGGLKARPYEPTVNHMNITEIFYSIQGESTYTGIPCVFIRTNGCNLRCSYCDTQYSFENGTEMSLQNIVEQVLSYPHTSLVEITGGEPMFQPDIYDLFNLLHKQDFQILLETNGTKDLQHVPDYVCKIIDVKTPSSGYHTVFHQPNLTYFHPEKDNIKFVLSDLDDYLWMKDFMTKNNLSGPSILVSAVIDAIDPHILIAKILEDALDVRFQLQIHKYIWNVP